MCCHQRYQTPVTASAVGRSTCRIPARKFIFIHQREEKRPGSPYVIISVTRERGYAIEARPNAGPKNDSCVSLNLPEPDANPTPKLFGCPHRRVRGVLDWEILPSGQGEGKESRVPFLPPPRGQTDATNPRLLSSLPALHSLPAHSCSTQSVADQASWIPKSAFCGVRYTLS